MRALICDVDGVLVQSMERNYETYRTVFGARGVELAQRDVYANEGRGARELIAAVVADRKLALDAAEVERMVDEHRELFQQLGALPLYPGVPAMLTEAKRRGWRVAVVSGNYRNVVARHLDPVRRDIDLFVTSEDVTHTKPHPEPYLAALAKLGLVPAQAVVVENAVLGIRSAKAAGLRCVAVASTMPHAALGEADVVVDAIPDVLMAIDGLQRR